MGPGRYFQRNRLETSTAPALHRFYRAELPSMAHAACCYTRPQASHQVTNTHGTVPHHLFKADRVILPDTQPSSSRAGALPDGSPPGTPHAGRWLTPTGGAGLGPKGAHRCSAMSTPGTGPAGGCWGAWAPAPPLKPSPARLDSSNTRRLSGRRRLPGPAVALRRPGRTGPYPPQPPENLPARTRRHSLISPPPAPATSASARSLPPRSRPAGPAPSCGPGAWRGGAWGPGRCSLLAGGALARARIRKRQWGRGRWLRRRRWWRQGDAVAAGGSARSSEGGWQRHRPRQKRLLWWRLLAGLAEVVPWRWSRRVGL